MDLWNRMRQNTSTTVHDPCFFNELSSTRFARNRHIYHIAIFNLKQFLKHVFAFSSLQWTNPAVNALEYIMMTLEDCEFQISLFVMTAQNISIYEPPRWFWGQVTRGMTFKSSYLLLVRLYTSSKIFEHPSHTMGRLAPHSAPEGYSLPGSGIRVAVYSFRNNYFHLKGRHVFHVRFSERLYGFTTGMKIQSGKT